MLDVKDVLDNIQHELGGGDLSAQLDKFAIINQAGHHLYSMHPWRWSNGRAALLDLRGVEEGETATWTAATRTLTQSSGFSTYSFLGQDEIRILAGTGATTGVYEIESRTSANAVVLVGSISATNLSTGDIEWRIEPQTISLPSDLAEIIAVATTSVSAIGGLTLVSETEIVEKRASSASITSSTGLFYGAVVFSGSPPVPLLEIYPSASDSTTGAMRIFYRSRWTAVTTDTEDIDIPEFVESLFLWIVRAFASGYERGGVASIHQRLAEVRASPIFGDAVRSDGRVQPYTGTIRNGGPMIWRHHGSPTYTLMSRVEAPAI